MIINYEELTLDGGMFSEMRAEFDMLMQDLCKKIENNNADEGSIQLKVDVVLEIVSDSQTGETYKVPKLKHKITSQVPVKEQLDGMKETGMQLVYDDILKKYVLKHYSIGGQMSMFDDEYRDRHIEEVRKTEETSWEDSYDYD